MRVRKRGLERGENYENKGEKIVIKWSTNASRSSKIKIKTSLIPHFRWHMNLFFLHKYFDLNPSLKSKYWFVSNYIFVDQTPIQ